MMVKLVLPWICFTLTHLNLFSETFACNQKDFGNGGTACLCDANYCDFIGPVDRPSDGKYFVYTSNLAGERFNKTEGSFVENILNNIDHSDHLTKSKKKRIYRRWRKLLALKRNGNEVILNQDQTYQEIFGFGGAFTDATGFNINSLPENLQDAVLRSYFSEDGIQYTLGRVPVGGTDFSPYPYSYDDGKEDKDLKNFALNDIDYKYKIPLVQTAKNMSAGLRLYASAWIAPKWMKSNNAYVGGTIKGNMYRSWANYYIRFFEEYDKNGIRFWGVTTGNEPSLALFPLVLANVPTVGWTPAQLGRWVSEDFGPAIRNSKYNDLKIMALDDQRLFLPGLYKMLRGPTNATNYIDGIAVHWYLDKYVPASTLTNTHNSFPEKFILATEACEGSTRVNKGVRLGSWERAENYAADIIEDLNNWVTGWVDWNMAVNMTGGPTYVNNIVDSPIIVDAENKQFYRNPMYYSLGQFSKFIPPGSVRVDMTTHRRLSMTGFKRPDNGVTVVILNKDNQTIPLTISRPGDSSIMLNVTSKSITTVYW